MTLSLLRLSTLYVASDVGVFRSTNGGTTWKTAGSKLPMVPVTDLEYRTASNTLYAATFGRGMFTLALRLVARPPEVPATGS